MAAYMKTDMPFYGVQKPGRETIHREVMKQFPLTTRAEYEAAVRGLWALPHREEKYLAIRLAWAYERWITKSSLRINESESLSTIIHKAIDDEAPIVVEDDGKDVGVITRADVLRTVIEGTEVS